MVQSPVVTTWRDYAEWRSAASAAQQSDRALQLGHPMPGTCGLCGSADGFSPAVVAADAREGLRCLACHCTARQRAAATVLMQVMPPRARPRLHLTEHASCLYIALRRRFPGTSGSEFVRGPLRRLRLSLWLWRHWIPGIVRHGDVTALGFQEAALDAVLSLDVLEHVPDAAAAVAELARVIAPGGVFVATVPFYEDAADSVRIADLSADGDVVFRGAPEYHGDPLGGGVPCFHHFGWRLLQDFRDAGFRDAAAHRVADAGRGLPHGIWVIVATR